MEGLVTRIAALETRASASAAIAKDFRVIDMHLARAEEKVLRLARSSHTRGELDVFLTEEQ